MRLVKKVSIMAAMLLTLPLAGMAQSTTGTIYYTQYGASPNVNKATFNYNGSNSFTVSSQTAIANTVGADGIIFAPDGDLLVGGQNNGHVSKVNINTAAITTKNPGVQGAYHLALSPDGTKAYTTNIPGALGFVSLSPIFANGSQITLTGNDTIITSLDLFGSNHVTQLNLDPSLTTYSDLGLAGNDTSNTPFQFDQGAPDGHGHLFVADNGGDLLFVDYSQGPHKVADAGNFVDHQFLAATLDDLAPLDGLGSSQTPEPGTFALFAALGVSGVGTLVRRLRRRK
jgi:hypothetical protein